MKINDRTFQFSIPVALANPLYALSMHLLSSKIPCAALILSLYKQFPSVFTDNSSMKTSKSNPNG